MNRKVNRNRSKVRLNKMNVKKPKPKGNSIKLINKKMKFTEVLKIYPPASEVFAERGMHCFGCSMASFETLEQGALMHGLDSDKIVDEINKKLRKKT